MRGDNEAALLILAYLMWVGYAMVLLGFSRARHAGSLLSLLGGGWMLAVLLYWAVGGALESGATLGGWVGTYRLL
ncbi:MAG: hypothetical protein KatS3mg115_1349 [Candidatus Poribacteria bacterium]|nr:MAG: hypothetical protein KatS3mg115_1349 [Candidatus Poribacteria bacterium]